VLAVLAVVFPPKAKAAVCVPQPPKYFLAVTNEPLLDHASTTNALLKLSAVELYQTCPQLDWLILIE